MKRKALTVEEVENEIRRMDPNIDGAQLRAATVLMSALQVGTKNKDLVAYTGYPKREVQTYVRNAYANGIFVGDMVGGGAWFKKDGGIAFWLDVCCALGWMMKAA